MKVTLASSFMAARQPGTATEGAPLLDPAGPRVVLGWEGDDLAAAIAPTSATLFGPRGVCLHPNGSLWVADTGHHRLLGWRRVPLADNRPADILVGQPDFRREGRNAKGPPGPASLNVPTGVTAFRGGLVVADPWNHRVLIWRRPPEAHNQPADIVLGQEDDGAVLANRGGDRPTDRTLHWPYGVAEIAGRLAVCDTGNRRVLVWDDPQETGQPADLVLGQRNFASRDENAGDSVSAASMRWPHAAAVWDGRVAVADAGNNRIMVWESLPASNGAPCDSVLGQRGFGGCDHNLGGYYPTDRALNMPYALVAGPGGLVVADTANSRLVGWGDAATGAPASRLTGQPDFAAKGDNRWMPAQRDSLCWPYGLSLRHGLVAIADSGNNRVLLWEVAR